jgi:hypothetical protein
MDILNNRKFRTPSKAIAFAVAMALGVVITISATVNAGNGKVSERFQEIAQHSLTGPLFVGPVEAVLANGKGIKVLGTTINFDGLGSHLLPAQYVAVFGELSANGNVSVHSVKLLKDVYSPGSSLVIYSGSFSRLHPSTGIVHIGSMAVDGLSIPGFTAWINSQPNSLFVVAGTQAMSGAPVSANLAVSFNGIGALSIDGTGLTGLDGQIIAGIDGSGLQGIDGSGLQGIDGSGIQGIDGSGLQGIDGSGIQGIDGSGLQGIDGSGLQGIDGSGLQGIDGSGLQGIDGSGLQGIDGSGLQGIDGSGLQGIDGSGLQGIDGSGRF